MDAIAFALGRRLSLIRGPPGTGKTITAALLVASALRLRGWQPSAAEGEAESGGGGEAEGSSGAAEAGAEEGAEADAEVLFARLQAISPGVQRRDYECSDEAGRPRWDRAGLESDLKLAGRAAAGAAAGASVGTAAGAHATGDVIGGRGSAQSEREGEGEGEGEGGGKVRSVCLACDPSSRTTRPKVTPSSASCAAPTQLETTTGAILLMTRRTSSHTPRTCMDAG